MACSSPTGPERLLFAIDAELKDHYDSLDNTSAAILNAPRSPKTGRSVAETLAKRKDGMIVEKDNFSSAISA